MTNAENATTTPDGTATASQTIAISGASGMVGTTLSDVLRHSGHSVISMSRKVSDSDKSSIVSNPASGLPPQLSSKVLAPSSTSLVKTSPQDVRRCL
ncbi:MAG TPA: hypothetical protein PLY87_06445 [Planctomycetaceae bacterium]|nr:hypothetical protein [Planctomycetaceae bacterium]